MIFLAILATWRLSSLFAEEEGPGEVFVKIRFKVTGRLLGMKGASCIWCMSIYFAAFFTALIFPFETSPWYEFLIWWFGLSGGAILTHTILQGLLSGRR